MAWFRPWTNATTRDIATPMTGQVPNPKSLFHQDCRIPNPQSLIPMVVQIPSPKSLIPACANALAAALLAPACAACSALLDEPLTGCVCSSCWRSVLPITPPVCDRCGDPLARQTQSLIPNPESLINVRSMCTVCCAGYSAVSRARAIGEYDGSLRDIIHALKYAGRLSLAKPLAAQMRRHGSEVLADVDCLVPVPLHWRRERQRGFNQAREIARHLGPPVVGALIRRRATRPQVELAADRRRMNVADAFAARRAWFRGSEVRGKKVLIVDDVSTTGATLEACAVALRDAGAAEVHALTAARVVTRRRHASLP
jgi:ComF family protein